MGDIANTLGLSDAVMKLIERRTAQVIMILFAVTF